MISYLCNYLDRFYKEIKINLEFLNNHIGNNFKIINTTKIRFHFHDDFTKFIKMFIRTCIGKFDYK